MKFEEMKRALISAAERAGIKEYEIYAQTGESLSAETLKDEISAFSSSVQGGISFRCIVNGRMGYAAGEWMTPDAMEELVQNAVDNAGVIDNDDVPQIFAGSAHYETVDLLPQTLPKASEIRDVALTLQKATYGLDEKITDGTQSVAMAETSEIYLCNSKGLTLSNRVGMSAAYVNAIVRDGEEAQEGFVFRLGEKKEDFAEIPEKAVTEALEKIGAGAVETGTYDVLFSGKQFREFLSAFSGIFSAKNAQNGLSLLAGKEGSQIASPIVTVTDDPMRKGSPMQIAFDGEGVATSRKKVVDKGVLTTLLYDLTTAGKAGVASTGNGQRPSYSSPVGIAPYQFGIEAGKDGLEELFRKVGNGIYVTECKGFHAGANSVTGDFSIESAGFRIRDGKKAEPIKSFTVAGNFFDFLQKIDALGKDVEWGIPSGFTAFGSPAVLVRAVGVAGK